MKGNLFLLLGFLTVKTLVAEDINKWCLGVMRNACELKKECYTNHFFYCDKDESIETCKKHSEDFRFIKNIEKACIDFVFSLESNLKKISYFLPKEYETKNLTEIQKIALAMFIIQLNAENKIDEKNIPNGYLLMASINTLHEDEDKSSQLILEKVLKAMPENLLRSLED